MHDSKKDRLKRILTDPKTLFWVWMIIAVTGMTRYGHGRENNYLIFKQVFWHVINQLPLFIHYPAEYFDINHYGPTFSLVIAPFAVLPTWVGMLLWLVALTLFLYFAIRRNQFTQYEVLNGVQMQQLNTCLSLDQTLL